jgi:hypothetical protein
MHRAHFNTGKYKTISQYSILFTRMRLLQVYLIV